MAKGPRESETAYLAVVRRASVWSGTFLDDDSELDHKLRGPVNYSCIQIFSPGTLEEELPDGG